MTNHIKWLLDCKCLSNIAHHWFFSTLWSTQNCIQIRKLSVLLWMTRCLNEIKIVFIDRIFIITNVEFMRLTNYTHLWFHLISTATKLYVMRRCQVNTAKSQNTQLIDMNWSKIEKRKREWKRNFVALQADTDMLNVNEFYFSLCSLSLSFTFIQWAHRVKSEKWTIENLKLWSENWRMRINAGHSTHTHT